MSPDADGIEAVGAGYSALTPRQEKAYNHLGAEKAAFHPLATQPSLGQHIGRGAQWAESKEGMFSWYSRIAT